MTKAVQKNNKNINGKNGRALFKAKAAAGINNKQNRRSFIASAVSFCLFSFNRLPNGGCCDIVFAEIEL